MTVKTMKKSISHVALASIKDETETYTNGQVLPKSVLEAWAQIPEPIREALVKNHISGSVSGNTGPTLVRSPSSLTSKSDMSHSANESSASNDGTIDLEVLRETCPETGATVELIALERAPKNVFALTKTSEEESTRVESSAASTVTTTTKIVTSSKGWRNVFTLPISYDVNMVSQGTIFDLRNPQLLQSTGIQTDGYNRRFAAVDYEVYKLYGPSIKHYFQVKGIELTICVLNGGEADKRPQAVDVLLDHLCEYKLRRREPFLAIGGGVLLDIAGMAASLYRRGVPFVRVPTTLLAIVDASVGVKNGVDYCCGITNDTYKNRIGTFYAPSACLLDTSFISSQDERNISNGFGEILKLALVRSPALFELLEAHGAALIASRFGPNDITPSWVGQRIIDLSIQIMLEELGPNLWEIKLDRCVDYGHTFSKLLEMVPGADIMHGEAVNVDGFFCVVLSHLRGYIPLTTVNRIFECMKSLSLPTVSDDLSPELAWQSCKDAVEHRHGEQRIPLITDIGESICVNDITPEELKRGIEVLLKFDH